MNKLWIFVAFTLTLAGCNDDESAGSPAGASYALFDLNQVPEITLEFTPDAWNEFLSNYDQNPLNEEKVPAQFTFTVGGQTTTLSNIGVKMRGNTSRRRPEGVTGQAHDPVNPDWHHCHFGLDFDKFVDDQMFMGRHKLNLKWFKDDANYVREVYSYDLFRRFDVWMAPKASYCRLTIKIAGDTSPAYFGVYAMLESIDADYIQQRMEHWGANAGYLWKCGHAGPNKPNFVQAQSMGVEDVSLDPSQSQYFAYDLKTRKSELEPAKAQLTSFISNLNNKTGQDFHNWISQSMDVDSFLRAYAVNVMVGMWDDYWVNAHNFYFYFSPAGKAYFIPYDYDNCLGTSLTVANSGLQDPLAWGPSSNRPLITKILAIPEYQTKYRQYLKQLVDPGHDLFAANKSMPRIMGWQNMISPYVSNDTGEDMYIQDLPAYWGNAPYYRLLSGNNQGGANGNANFFSTRETTITW